MSEGNPMPEVSEVAGAPDGTSAVHEPNTAATVPKRR